jgi:hypothetical protein
MCQILECLDGTTIESCGELRTAGYIVPSEIVNGTDLTADNNCLCNVDLSGILAQQPQRKWAYDPFGLSEVTP